VGKREGTEEGEGREGEQGMERGREQRKVRGGREEKLFSSPDHSL
jgi:hypothetical protein